MEINEALRVTVLTDGRAGNRAQALALAEALARRGRVEIVEPPFAPPRLATALPPALAYPLAGRVLALPDLPACDLIIGAGRRVAPYVAAFGRQGIPNVQLLSPQMKADPFAAIVAPEHDGLEGENVLASLGALSRITPARIAAEGALWAETFAPLPSPRIAVLLGGPSKSANWERRDHDRLIAQLKALETQEMGLIITPSRRTEPALTEAIRTACPRAYLWDMTGENPYPGLLAHVDAVVVTEDSVNMASEAASTGLPVHVFRISALALKLKRFHARLEDHGAARVFSGPIRYWDYPPLAEADRIAEALIQRLGLALG